MENVKYQFQSINPKDYRHQINGKKNRKRCDSKSTVSVSFTDIFPVLIIASVRTNLRYAAGNSYLVIAMNLCYRMAEVRRRAKRVSRQEKKSVASTLSCRLFRGKARATKKFRETRPRKDKREPVPMSSGSD